MYGTVTSIHGKKPDHMIKVETNYDCCGIKRTLGHDLPGGDVGDGCFAFSESIPFYRGGHVSITCDGCGTLFEIKQMDEAAICCPWQAVAELTQASQDASISARAPVMV